MSVTQSFFLGDLEYTLSTGEIARQASGAVTLQVQDTVLLATCVVSNRSKPELGFVPLTVDYSERSYAAGRIPGGHFKREVLPPDHATRAARRIDRALRPLFPANYCQETHIVVQVMSAQPEIATDVLGVIAASAALALSGVCLLDHVGCVRIGFLDNRFVVNPSQPDIPASLLDVVVAANRQGVVAVDGSAQEQPDDVIQDAIAFGHMQNQSIIQAIQALAHASGRQVPETEPLPGGRDLAYKLYDEARQALDTALDADPDERPTRVESVRQTSKATLEAAGSTAAELVWFKHEFEALLAYVMRQRLITGERRFDGRDAFTVRPIVTRQGELPGVHGSALLTQGDSQILSTVTLGAPKEAQLIETLAGKHREHFIIQNNTLPFATGATGRFGIPKRSDLELSHLIKSALEPLLPDLEAFPYTLRLVNERLESGDAAAMPTVAAATLALFDAGVPLRTATVGTTIGLVQEGDRHILLSDLSDDELPLCSLTVNVAGTKNGVTALQIDARRTDLPLAQLNDAFTRARAARIALLDTVSTALQQPHRPTDELADVLHSGAEAV